MGLILDHIDKGNAHILIWKDEESIDFFLEKVKLSKADQELLETYTVERRQKDLLIARYLLQQLVNEASVVYLKTGKPYLENSHQKISISHTKDLVGVILHPDKDVSIDIEYISPRVEKLKTRFLSDKEIQATNTLDILTLMWSAKECLFKIDQLQGLDFKKDLHLDITSEQTLQGCIRQKDTYTINYKFYKDWVLCYTMK